MRCLRVLIPVLLVLGVTCPVFGQRPFRSSRLFSRPPEDKPPEASAPASPSAEAPKPADKPPETKPSESSPDPQTAEPTPSGSVTKRPNLPSDPPRAEELKLRPGPDGKIRFDFRGQPWPEVVQWLADVSGLSLDWQELPGDFLNLTTQRGFTVEEARDLINRHLLARGLHLVVARRRAVRGQDGEDQQRLGPPRRAGRTGPADALRIRQGFLALGLADGRERRGRTEAHAERQRTADRVEGHQPD